MLVFTSFELQCRDFVHENSKREELTTWISADTAWMGFAWWPKAFMRWLGSEDITDIASAEERSNRYGIMLFCANFLSVTIQYLWLYLMIVFFFNLQSFHILTVFNKSASWCKARVRRGAFVLCVFYNNLCHQQHILWKIIFFLTFVGKLPICSSVQVVLPPPPFHTGHV